MLSSGTDTSDEDFVDQLYEFFLRRPPDASGRAYYVNQLKTGRSRLEVTREIATSGEFFDLLCRQAFGGQTGNPFLAYAPPGHFLSPIPALTDVDALLSKRTSFDSAICQDVNMNIDGQLGWLATLSPYAADLSFSKDGPGETRYYSENDSFALGDAVLLASLMRYARPVRIVEVGAGFSTAVMLDISERYLGNSVLIDSIEPYPDRLRGLLRGNEAPTLTIHEVPVQNVELPLFQRLSANDILFIDSSHVLKLGSDVAFLLFEVLPRIERGVFVHFHDIAWPFEYPSDWYRMGRAWNEVYAVRSFLAFNPSFQLVWFADYVMRAHRDAVGRYMPLALQQRRGIPDCGNSACSFWLQRI